MKFVKEGHKFEIRKRQYGYTRLIYTGRVEDPWVHSFIWDCDDTAEAMNMVDAIIDPKRYADDEYNRRHEAEFASRCKW